MNIQDWKRTDQSCQYCEDGVLHEDEQTKTTVCDSCFAANRPRDTISRARKQRLRRQRRQSPTHNYGGDDDRRRMCGGYHHAYYSWVSGPEYAIDEYGEKTDGLLVPHKRDWRY